MSKNQVRLLHALSNYFACKLSIIALSEHPYKPDNKANKGFLVRYSCPPPHSCVFVYSLVSTAFKVSLMNVTSNDVMNITVSRT